MAVQRADQRNTTLDALRGVAASIVVVFHLSQVGLLPWNPVASGFLSVDFFFILSGFVLAHIYERQLQDPDGFGKFIVGRVTRILPLAVLGVLIGACILLIKWAFFPGRVGTLPAIVSSVLANLFLLPAFFVDADLHHDLFPSNGPLWSLFFEMAASVAWGMFGSRASTRSIVYFAILSALLLLVFQHAFGSANIGFDRATFFGGFPRVGLGFSIGLVLARWRRLRVQATRSGALVFLSGLLVLALSAPISTPASASIWPLLCEIFVFPMIILVAVSFPDSGPFGQWLGRLSYPIYILHFPVLLVASGFSRAGLTHGTAIESCAIAILGTVTVAALSLRYYEPIARTRLKKALSVIAGYSPKLGRHQLAR